MRLIDADALVIRTRYGGKGDPELDYVDPKDIASAPTIEVGEPRGDGEWLTTDAVPHHVFCSVCFKTFIPNAEWSIWIDGDLPRKYCPNCGAKMKATDET